MMTTDEQDLHRADTDGMIDRRGEVVRTVIGKGWLSWPRMERVSDRYGTVGLYTSAMQGKVLTRGLEGRTGRLYARVTAQGLSEHIGDLFRGFAPPRTTDACPPIGSEHVLGEGTVFYDEVEGTVHVGLEPADGRDADWLDPETLYLLHEQEVELRLEES
jgi:hypothetical protein